MINVYIIDNLNEIELSLVKANMTYFNDEIKALNAIEQEQPSVVLLNYAFLKEGTAEYIRVILAVSPKSNIVIIGDGLDDVRILSCLIIGAQGYQQLKQINEYAERLIEVVDAGEAWITRRMVSTLLDALRGQMQ